MKVRIISDTRYNKDLTKDKIYEVVNIDKGRITVVDDVGDTCYLVKKDYEIVKDEFSIEEMEFIKEVVEECKKMKEKNFREVIADIKEGEVWENNQGKKIIKDETGIKITHEDVYAGGYFIALFDDKTKYKLQRKEYSFNEAFKAYEEGKEIESCESGERYIMDLFYGEDCKLIQETNDWLNHAKLEEIISFDEIRNKWYIND